MSLSEQINTQPEQIVQDAVALLRVLVQSARFILRDIFLFLFSLTCKSLQSFFYLTIGGFFFQCLFFLGRFILIEKDSFSTYGFKTP